MDEKRILETKISLEKGDSNIVSIFKVNNSYYSVVYQGKEEYYSKDLKICKVVGKMILLFHKNLYKSGKLFYAKEKSDEERWGELISFLSSEGSKTFIDKKLCISIYKTIEQSYYDSLDIDDNNIVVTRNTINGKDNLMKTINDIASLSDKKEANKNLMRYKVLRNKFVKSNPQLGLDFI